MDDRVMDRWFALEMVNFHRGLVTASRPLSDLMLEEIPRARTRAGEDHLFDKRVLQRFHDALSPLERRRLRLPVTIYVDKDFPTDAAIQDETAAGLLRALGELPEGREVREGRLWLSHAQAQAIAQRHPTAFQFIYT